MTTETIHPVPLLDASKPRPDGVVRRRKPIVKVGSVVGLVTLIIAAVFALGPLLWTLTTSLRTPAASFNNPPQWFPVDWDFSNYTAVFHQLPIGQFFLNSVVVTLLIVVGQTVTCSLSGYAFAMISFPGKNTIFGIFLATMMVPIQTIIIPVFVILKDLGLTGSIASLIIPALGSAFGTFLMRQYFMQMPKELGEAARIDGASQFGVFRHIYIRMASPAVATLAILNFSGFWAEYYRPLIFLNQQNTFTLPLGLVALQGNLGTGS
ncbi:MAG: sugar transporter permease, partial [Frondihabitans sp.]|nr:sugar transporter permease [Frondihabitans sp.]